MFENLLLHRMLVDFSNIIRNFNINALIVYLHCALTSSSICNAVTMTPSFAEGTENTCWSKQLCTTSDIIDILLQRLINASVNSSCTVVNNDTMTTTRDNEKSLFFKLYVDSLTRLVKFKIYVFYTVFLQLILIVQAVLMSRIIIHWFRLWSYKSYF